MSIVNYITRGHLGYLKPCGDFANEAYNLLSKKIEVPLFDTSSWTNLMRDTHGRVFAVYHGEDAIITTEINYADCPEAFNETEEP